MSIKSNKASQFLEETKDVPRQKSDIREIKIRRPTSLEWEECSRRIGFLVGLDGFDDTLTPRQVYDKVEEESRDD